MTRLLNAAAALLVVALLVLAPGVSASAAPQDGLCTVKEWADPSKYLDCAHRLTAAGARRVECVHAPTPASPDAGMAGWLTSRPDAGVRPGVVGRYSLYGVGGYRLDMYDVTCAGAVVHPEATLETSLASLEFSGAAAILGGANTLRETAYQPGSMWGWSDGFVGDVTDTLYRHVFATLGAVTLAVAGLWLIGRARRGQWSEALRVAGWAVFVLVLTTAVVRYPLQAAHGADRAAAGGLAVLHRVLGPAPADLPADRCPFPDQPEACQDHRTVAVRASDEATETLLYRGWLRAEFGSADSVTARKYGPALFDAATLSWAESANIDAHPDLRASVFAGKAEQWTAIAEQVKAEDPAAYENLQGLRGEDRVGAGFVTLASTLVYTAFDLAASIVILFGFGVFRLVVMLLPLLATFGMFQPASGMVRWAMNAFVSAALNIVLFGGAAGLYLMIAGAVFASPLAGLLQVAVVAVAGVALWLLLRPVRRIRLIFRQHRDESEPEGPSWRSRLWSATSSVVVDAAVRAAKVRTDEAPVRAEGWAGAPRPELLALPSGRSAGVR